MRIFSFRHLNIYALSHDRILVHLDKFQPRPGCYNMYNQYTDIDLIKFLQSGDEAAFTEIYKRYWDILFYLAGKKLNDLHEAEGVVQEIFLDLWKRREHLNILALDNYLVVAVKYRILNILAHRERKRRFQQFATENYPVADVSTDDWISFEELRSWLEKSVNQLPEKCRIAYQLRDEGYSQKEIAAKMDISEKTVESHISKALKILRSGIGRVLSLFY